MMANTLIYSKGTVMEKENVIELLQKAKKAHIQWVVRAQALTLGLPIQLTAPRKNAALIIPMMALLTSISLR